MGLNFWIFWFLKIFEFFIFWSKTLKTHQIDGFRSRGPSKNARGYRFHAYKLSNHHITSIIDIVFMFSLEIHDRKNWKKTQNSWKNAKFKILQLQPWDLAQKIGLDLRIPDHTLTSLCDHWASSYEGFKWAIEFRSQCCILLFA